MRAEFKGLLALTLGAVFTTTGLTGIAQADFPEKPITIIYPWAPGDPVETVLRNLGKVAAKELGQPFVINNIKGAGGKKAMVAGAKAAADGYTLTNNWVAPQIAGKLFDPSLAYTNDSYIPIGGVFAIPFTVTVAADHPANNVADLVKWAKEKGGKLNYGVCAAQSVPRLVGEQFMRSAGIAVNPIPNNTGCMGDNMTGLLNGTLDVSVGVVPATRIMKGQVKHLTLISDEPHPLAPKLKTAKEQGVEIGWGNAALGWGGLVVPAGTPDAEVKALQAAVAKAIKSDEFHKGIGPLTNMIKYVPPAEFKKLWGDSMVLLKPYVDELKSK